MGRLMGKHDQDVDQLEVTDIATVLEPYDSDGETEAAGSWLDLVWPA